MSTSGLSLEGKNVNQPGISGEITCVESQKIGDMMREHGRYDVGVMNMLACGWNLRKQVHQFNDGMTAFIKQSKMILKIFAIVQNHFPWRRLFGSY